MTSKPVLDPQFEAHEDRGNMGVCRVEVFTVLIARALP
jgi:hypothetical protein